MSRTDARLGRSPGTPGTVTLCFLLLAAAGSADAQQFAPLRVGLPREVLNTTSFAAGDVDGDGNVDLVLGNTFFVGGASNRLYLGDGNGGFAPAPLPPSSERTNDVALLDVDGDGDLDLFAGNDTGTYFERRSKLYLNDGRGVFREVTGTHLPQKRGLFGIVRVAVGDLDGDRDPDILLGAAALLGGGNAVYSNDGKGHFTEKAGAVPGTGLADRPLLVDVDRDGDLDAVVETGLSIWINDGTATFRADSSRLPQGFDQRVSAAAVGDFDGDGDADILVGSQGLFTPQPPALLLNLGTGRFVLAPAGTVPGADGGATQIRAGDVDHDGDLDAVLVSRAASTQLWLNDGTGRLLAAATPRMPATPAASAALLVDVDHDGDLDLALAHGGLVAAANGLWFNLHRHVLALAPPRRGTGWAVELVSRLAYPAPVQGALPYVAMQTLSPRVRIDPFGVLGLDPRSLVALPAVGIPPPGRFTLQLGIPNAASLQGRALYVQALVVAGPPIDLHLSNVWADRVQ